MMGYTHLLSGSIYHNISNLDIIIQAQDPWITFFSQVSSVIIGGIIALIANYFLQRHSFRIQNQTNLLNERISAYNSLIGHISNFELKSDPKFLLDMDLYLARAATYGSLDMKNLIKPLLGKKIDPEFLKKLPEIKESIIEEITKEN